MIPNHIPQHMQPMWQSVYNESLSQGQTMATVLANKWVLQNSVVREPVCRASETLVPIKFAITAEHMIVRSSEGQDYVTAVLSDDQPYWVPDMHGQWSMEQFTGTVLEKFAATINKETPVGDMDHKFYDTVLKQNFSDEMIKRALKQKPGIVKAVQAVVNKGKLYLRLLIDKRYKKVIEKAKGLSLEAMVSKDSTGKVVDGTLLGFTVAVDHTPVNQRAVMLN
jgi:hypothetical protein